MSEEMETREDGPESMETCVALQETERQEDGVSDCDNPQIRDTDGVLEETEKREDDISGQYKTPTPVSMDIDRVTKEKSKLKRSISAKRFVSADEDQCRNVENFSEDVYKTLASDRLHETKSRCCKISNNSPCPATQEISLNAKRSSFDARIIQSSRKGKPEHFTEEPLRKKAKSSVHERLLYPSYSVASPNSVQDHDTSSGPPTSKKARMDIQSQQEVNCSKPQTSCAYRDDSAVQEHDVSSDGPELGTVETSDDGNRNLPGSSLSRHHPDEENDEEHDVSSDGPELGTVETSDDGNSNLPGRSLSKHHPDDLGIQTPGSESKSPNEGSGDREECHANIKLEILRTYSDEELADKILHERCCVHDLVNDPNISENTTCQLLKLFAKVTLSSCGQQRLANIFVLTLSDRFLDHLQKLQISFMKSSENNLTEFYENLLTVLTCYCKVMPKLAIDRCSNLLQMIMLVLPKLNGLHDTHMKYSNLVDSIQEFKLIKKEPTEKRVQLPKYKLTCLDSVEPMEDFRCISVEPTNLDINVRGKPFLRRNIVKGQYENVDTYLDIQFRLLREDFIRPLREGIAHYKNNVHTKNRSVRIYKNVQVLYSNIIEGKMTHFIKVYLPRNFRLESSKRMLFGNLLCLSADNFESCVFATVSSKNDRDMKEGIIGITPLPKSKVDHSATYTVAESRTFFVAYRYVLSTLQQMSNTDVPFQEQLVQVSGDVLPPKYLKCHPDVRYDLRVVLNPRHMKESERSWMFARANTRPPPAESNPSLKEVAMSIPVTDWPHHDDFGLDESQLRALHCALTKRLAIIQGPPGTGKTYLGLKIAQVLLHNSQVWSGQTDEDIANEEVDLGINHRLTLDVPIEEEPQKSPILVICYTNHALDQFLEGMQSFTKKIVRVGGRSKSSEIQSYQINKLVSSMIAKHKVPSGIFYSMKDMSRSLDRIKSEYNYLQALLRKVKDGFGLLRLTTFEEFGIIPVEILEQFADMSSVDKSMSPDYLSWILPENFNVPATNDDRRDAEQDTNEEDQDEEDQWRDDLTLISEEEKNRLPFDDMADSRANIAEECENCFELTLERCYTDLECLKEEKRTAKRFRRRMLAASSIKAERRLNWLRHVVSFDWVPYELEDGEDILSLSFDARCRLYGSWCDKLNKKFRCRLRCLETDYRKLSSSVELQRTARQLYVARRADVVGVTTTGAAQHQALLRQLAPSIVIVEEAAEILEAHVLAALSTSCQHLIMIGDHQQLKPSTAVYELAKKYGLETSMFERLLNNGISYETLHYQHRMRPEISRLLVPSVYPALLDAPVVHKALPMRGLNANMFFVAHRHAETQDTDDNGSHSNPHEARFLAHLARHLLLQGYSQSQITVLTPYSGQFFLLRKELRRFSACEGIRVSVVDNFQGEESDIVLLSLVRSNVTGGVGFLKSENRVCVALSRAKIGLYMIGNMEQLSRESSLWKTIRATLEGSDSVGQELILRCQNHPLEKTTVASAEDFLNLSSDGGCRKMCLTTLPGCGHHCPRVCHVENMDHKYEKCVMPCNKWCNNDHPCPLKCWQICQPCVEPAEKTLRCGHNILTTCGATNIKCRVEVEKVIPSCKHAVLVPCHVDPRGEKCQEPCETRLDCGHPCRLRCHGDKDPDHLEYLCTQPCTRLYKDCARDHVCKDICYLECSPCPRLVKKKMKCGHNLVLKCRDVKKGLSLCSVEVTKTLPQCGHKIQAECGAEPDPSLCLAVCVRTLACGHLCGQLCGQPCATQCSHLVLTEHKCPRGHTVSLPCHLSQAPTDDDLLRFCTAPCEATLQCQHPCGGTCSGCLQGRLHRSCSQPCTRTLICGHVCQEACSMACPPCQKPCPWRCQHSRCRRRCGDLCCPCQEPCSNYCSHKINCGQKCGEVCRCEPCRRPCPEKLSCGHPCVGFCGDPCPKKCRICDQSDLSEILFGEEDEPDARFVLLPDCGHAIESKGLARWLQSPGDGSLQMKRCPMCQQPIYNLKRFKNLILQTSKDVRLVIARSRAVPSVSWIEIYRRVSGLRLDMEKPPVAPWAFAEVMKTYDKLEKLEKNCSNVAVKRRFTRKLRHMESGVDLGDQQLCLFLFQTKVLESAMTACTKLRGDFRDQLRLVLTRVMKEKRNASSQLQQEVSQELQRIVFLSSFSSLKLRLMEYPGTASLRQQIDELSSPSAVFTTSVEQKAVALLKQCRKKMGGLGVTEMERLQIVKAMGMAKGHWYKCPQGHIYYIGECGGAMQTSVCPECKQTVGGNNHRLVEGNQHAPEMDGSVQAAWPPH